MPFLSSYRPLTLIGWASLCLQSAEQPLPKSPSDETSTLFESTAPVRTSHVEAESLKRQPRPVEQYAGRPRPQSVHGRPKGGFGSCTTSRPDATSRPTLCTHSSCSVSEHLDEAP